MFKEQLVITGSGIRIVGQLTFETIAYLRRAERIFYVMEDPIAEDILSSLNSAAQITNLSYLYEVDKPRIETYRAMVECILHSVRTSSLTLCTFYGHPGVMAYPGHEAIRRARAEGFSARMLPAISAEDCLFADLGIDPATNGCQSYEATHFLLTNASFSPCSHLILWQVGSVGDLSFQKKQYNLSLFPQLIERLLQHYPSSHEVTVYEASLMLGCEPLITRLPLENLSTEVISPRSTLSIPPIISI